MQTDLSSRASNDGQLRFWPITWRTLVVHTISYFVVGLLALTFFNYSASFSQPPLSYFMRPTSDPLVAAGVLFQPLRGLLFGLVFYLLRERLFAAPRGWLVAWAVLAIVGIFSTFGPAPGSIEGLIYTTLPLAGQLGGLTEILTQSLLLAALTVYWVRRPRVRWFNWALMLLFVVVLLLPLLGLLARQAQAAPLEKSYLAERYDVQLVLQPGGLLEVTETTVFRFEGGPFTEVFRDLDYTELDEIEQVRAAADGQALPPGTGPGQVEIRPGRPLHVAWHLAPTADAVHTFTLSYRVRGAVRQDGADTLIWRAIPEKHDYRIQTGVITLEYPPSLRLLELPVLNRTATSEPSPARISFTVTGLEADQDAVITARFLAGSLITAPPAWQARQIAQAAATAEAWPYGALAGVLTLVAGLLGLWMLSRAQHRVVLVERPTPTSIPPSDLPPALVGRLAGQAASFMGTLFDLAQCGWLEIREQPGWLGSKRYYLELKPGPDSLRPHEQALVETLFKPGQVRLAMSEVPTRLAGRQSFDQQLDLELTSRGWLDPQRKAARSQLGMLWLVGVIVAIAFFLGGVVWGGIMPDVARDSFIMPALVMGLGVGLFLAAVIGLVYAASLSPLTPAGEVEAVRWKGFGLYLEEVSQGKELAVRTDDFERYLPLAAVFGLGASWAKYFQELGDVPLPVWFQASASSVSDFGAIIAVMAASDSAGAGAAGAGAGASGGGASGAH